LNQEKLVKDPDSYAVSALSSSLAAALATPALFLSPQAQAQSTGGNVTEFAPVQVEGQSSDPYQVRTVPSPKFTAPILDTGRNVTVVPQQVIKDQQATTLNDVLRNSPGITFGAGEGGRPGGDLPIIRGQSAANNIFIDGLRDPGIQTRDTFNIESVEIIKGPDSVYAGRGSAGGSINLTTKAPKNENFATGSVQVGTDSNYRATADGNWVLNDKAAFRLNVMGDKGNVPGRNDAVDFSRYGIAPSLTLGIGTPTRITFSYLHYYSNNMPDYSIPYDPQTGTPVTVSKGVNRNTFYGLVDRDFQIGKNDVGMIKFEHDIGDALQFRNVMSYGRTLTNFVATNPDDSQGNVTRDLVMRALKSGYYWNDTFSNLTDLTGDFNTGSLKHTFDVGLEYTNTQQSKDGYTQTIPTAPMACTGSPSNPALCTSVFSADPHTDYPGRVFRNNNPAKFNTDTIGIYGFDTVKLNEQWQVSGGLRWDKYSTSGHNIAAGRNDPVGTPAFYSASVDDDLWNYQLGVAYKPAPNGTIYATYGTSSTPSPVSGSTVSDAVSLSNSALKPEKSQTAEIGTKWDVFDDRLSLTADVFHDIRKNTSVAVSATETAQIGKARVQGLELGFSGAVTPKWNVFGGYTYMQSKQLDGAYNSGAVGRPLPNTPQNSFSLWNTYRLLPKLTVGGGAFYVSKVYGNSDDTFNADGTPKVRYVPSYWRFDAMAAYEINKNLSVQLNILNIFNETYFQQAYATHYAQLGTGRAGLLTLNVKY
jgi:catecholate siderophore receptor